MSSPKIFKADSRVISNIDELTLPSGENIFDDDSGGGLFGTDAQLTFTAKTSDYHYIEIENNFSDWATAYTLAVTEKK